MKTNENIENTVNESNNDKTKNRKTIREYLDGTILTRDLIIGQLPFLIFLMFLAIGYIANRYHSEKTIRRINKLQIEVKELHSEYTSITSELMKLSKQSKVAYLVEETELGLVEATTPPKIIKINKKKWK